MSSPRVRTIALYEYWGNVRRREFLLVTLGFPIFFLLLAGVGALGAGAMVRSFSTQERRRIGLVDHSGLIAGEAAGRSDREGFVLVPFRSEEEGQKAVRDRRVASLVVVARDYLDSGRVTVYRPGGGFLEQAQGVPVSVILRDALLRRAHLDRRLAERIRHPEGPGSAVFTLERGRFVPQSGRREAARFAVPYTFTILLTTSIFIAANYLLRGISEEKENRVIEVILSSVTPGELLFGKLLGGAAVGLTQVGVWILLAAAPAMLLYSTFVRITPGVLALAVLFFALGFGLYATLMAGLGALGTSYRESQQIAGAVSIGAFFPFALIPVLITLPNGTLARVLSFIPFTAPTTMVLRVTAADVPAWEVGLSALVIVLATWLLARLSKRLFRFGLLIYGKRPGLRETLRWLRAA